ncbi:MAG: VOC family protein [Paracoccaceae bacterium]|nr:VOC family protein [Paracoccaceae bacterium]MDP7184826.1 VOC family protein [Paracoccaceae bacterium]
MEQRLSMITLGVDDLARAKAFYEGLGWQAEPMQDEGIVAFNLIGMVLALYPWAHVAAEVGMSVADYGRPNVMVAYNVREKSEVASILAKAQNAGGTIVKPAQDVFWGGHSGYFRDLDGHYWEVAHNPFSPVGPKGGFQWGGGEGAL